MIQNAIGLINSLQKDDFFREITKNRSLASVPISGKYRIIDFPLSNLVNSGISKVGIMVQSKYGSLMDHLRAGKEWGPARKREGLYFLPPATENNFTLCRGELDCFYQNIEYLKRSRHDYVILTGVNVIANIDYTQAFEQHTKTGADITIIYNCPEKQPTVHTCCVLEMSDDARITAIESTSVSIKPENLSMEMYIMKRELLISMVERCVARGEYEFITDIIIKNIKSLKIYGYKHEGYVARIHSVQAYYEHNMDMLTPKIWKSLFSVPSQIYTKVKDHSPAKYLSNAKTKNALISDECLIDGEVENSILSRGVTIKKGAKVKNCIIMESCIIDEDVLLQHVILDKQVHVTANKKMLGVAEYPIIIEKKAVI